MCENLWKRIDSGITGHILDIKDLLANPNTAPYSRIKYLLRFGSDDQIADFLKGLFEKAVEGKNSGDWDSLSDYLDEWDEVGIGLQFDALPIPDQGAIPWAPVTKSLNESKIALVTTGGVYLEGQTPYSERDDISYREIDRDAPHESFNIWHPGYDNGPANQDINCIFPIDRFKELESEGVIGSLAQTHYSFMGLIHNTEGLSNESASDVASKLKEDGVDAVFLAST